MSDLETKRSTENARKVFAAQPLEAAAMFIASVLYQLRCASSRMTTM